MEEAARVADEAGLDRLTLAAVAQRLGVALPSLYKHVRGSDDLLASLAVVATHELGAALLDAAAGRAGTDALRSVAGAYRGYALAHPGRYAATVRAPAADDTAALAAATDVFRTVASVLRGYGIADDDDAIDATRAIRSALHGFVALELAGGFGMPRDVDRSFVRLVDGLDTLLAGWRRP